MATDLYVPVVLPQDSDDYISQYGSGTAAVYLAYGSASPPTDGTATTLVVSGTERYEFWPQTALDSYFQFWVGDGSDEVDRSSVFQAPLAYASLQELKRGLDFPDASRDDELETLLIEATDYITEYVCGGRSFFRDPVGTGETTLTLDIERHHPRLSVARGAHLDIVSLSSVKVAGYTGDTLDTLTAGSTGYYLRPDDPQSGHPYTDVILSDQGTAYTTFEPGYGVVQLTGVFGWSAVPAAVRRATVDLARLWWNQRGGDGEPVGMNAFGSPIFTSGLPSTVRALGKSGYAWKDWVG